MYYCRLYELIIHGEGGRKVCHWPCSCRRSRASFWPVYCRTSDHVPAGASPESGTSPWQNHSPSLPAYIADETIISVIINAYSCVLHIADETIQCVERSPRLHRVVSLNPTKRISSFILELNILSAVDLFAFALALRTSLLTCSIAITHLHAFSTSDAHTNVGSLDHTDIIGSVTNGQGHLIQSCLHQTHHTRLQGIHNHAVCT